MKRIAFIFLVISLVVSCSDKQEYEMASTKTMDSKDSIYKVSEPFRFKNAKEFQQTLSEYRYNPEGLKVKSSNFISYAETVMEEEGYDEKPGAINSEIFGSFLNMDGEVVFADVLLKLCRFGVLYAPEEKRNALLTVCAADDIRGMFVKAQNCPDYISSAENLYALCDDPEIQLFDAFGYMEDTSIEDINTKSGIYGNKDYSITDEDYFSGNPISRWDKTFKLPAPGNQKTLFTNNICNDTKVYRENFGIYSESGVKTKTMKKNGIGVWSKFSNQVCAGITGLVLIEENPYTWSLPNTWTNPEWYQNEDNQVLGINVASIDIAGSLSNEDVVVATVIKNNSLSEIIGMSETSLNVIRNQAIQWAQDRGVTVSQVDAIRFYGTDYILTRFSDRIYSGVSEKKTQILEFFWGGHNMKIESTIIGVSPYILTTSNHQYFIKHVVLYGYSTYGGSSLGARVTYDLPYENIY